VQYVYINNDVNLFKWTVPPFTLKTKDYTFLSMFGSLDAII